MASKGCTTEPAIPLHLIGTSSFKKTPSIITTSTTNPFLDTESTINPFSDTASAACSLLPSAPTTPFLPTSTLQIQAEGKAAVGFPNPPKQLEIPIFSPETGRPVYLSVREKRKSGDCVLVDAEKEDGEEGKILASTEFTWGPGKYPIVKIRGGVEAEEFEIVNKSMLNRTVEFVSRVWGGKFEWRYAGKEERGERVDCLLVLEKVVDGDKGERIRIAQLMRGDETRTPGTRGSHAGNGGRLEMRLEKEGGEQDGKIVSEVIVVVTSLVMLKKEIDRRRILQGMVMVIDPIQPFIKQV
ncbi:hypothetical protein B0O99DRAFT_628077 [Bisporella sp. PMI_857]|nr:hypothetical protein B0O99DRAFT_628077 [Bisporella sp. PMI_857]